VTEGRDPFADLGGDEGARRRAEIGRKLEQRDREAPEPDMPPRRPEMPRAGNRYAWLVGILMLMGIGVLLFTTALPNTGEGVRGPEEGSPLPDFAAPLASGETDGDANVRQTTGGSDNAGRVPACAVRGRSVVNSCELRRKPVVITFVVTKGADCEPQVDRLERVYRDFPEVNFAVVMSGNDKGEAAKIARNRRWTQPVAVDQDGAVVNLYGVGVCPTTVFALRGGEVRESTLGNLTEDELRAKLRALVRSQRAVDRRA
jgi:peroxiredoxin